MTRVLAMLRRLRPALPDLRDLHVYGGLLLLSAGVGSAWAPAGLAVAGGVLMYIGLSAGRSAGGE